MSELNPTVAEFLNMPDHKSMMTYELRQIAQRSLDDITKAIGALEDVSAIMDTNAEDTPELLSLISDMSYSATYLSEIKEILEDYEVVCDVLADWQNHAENRLTEDQEEELDQERMINKLKGT